MTKGNCKFSGSGGQYFTTVLIHLFVLSGITFGLYAPWAWVKIFRLKASHTTLNGKEVRFIGTGGQLLVLSLVQGILTLLTLGLYGPWAICKFFEWKAQNTLVGESPSQFNGTGGELFPFYLIHMVVLPILTLGIYCFYSLYRLYAWKEEHTRYGGEKSSFGAGFLDFFKVSIVGSILNSLTLNLFTPWSLSMLYKWQIQGLAVGEEHSVDHFPPVRTNMAAVAALVVIGLLPALSIGLFVKSQYDKFAAVGQMSKAIKMVSADSAGANSFRADVHSGSQNQHQRPAQKPAPGQVQKKPEIASPKPSTSTKVAETPSAQSTEKPEVLYNRACSKAAQGNFSEADKIYTQVITLDKKYTDAYYNRGLARMEMKQYDHAVSDFTSALELDPKFYEAYCNRANAHFRAGRSDSAIKDYEMAIRLKPDDGDLHFNRGVVLQSVGQMAAAEEDFKEAGRLGQKNAIAFLQSPSAAMPKK